MLLEARGIDAVPVEERHGHAHDLFFLWFAANLGFPAWYIGVLAVLLGLSEPWGLAAVALGTVIGSVLVAGAAALGPATGRGSLPQSGRAFGRWGVRVPALFTGVSCLGWLAVNTVLGTDALASLFGWPPLLALAVLIIVQVGLTVFGYDMIHRIERLASIVLLILFGWMAIRTLRAPVHAGLIPLHVPMAILTVAIAASYVFSWGPYAADYSRYLPRDTSRRAVFGWTLLGSAASTLGVMALGVLMALRFHVTDPMALLGAATGHLRAIAYLAVVFGTLTANVLNIYTGATSTLTLGVSLNRVQAIILVGLLGFPLTWSGLRGFSGQYENFLLLISYWVSPWLAVLFFDAMHPGDDRQDVGWGLFAFLVGVLASVPFMSQTLWTGWVARAWGGADIAYYVGFVVAFGAMWIRERLRPAGTRTVRSLSA